MEALEVTKKRKIEEGSEFGEDGFVDDLEISQSKKFRNDGEESGTSTPTSSESENKTESEASDGTGEEDIFGAVKYSVDELNFDGGNEFGTGDMKEFSCFLNEDGDVILNQISASFNNSYALDELMIQPIIQEIPDSPPSIFCPQSSVLPTRTDRIESIQSTTSNRKIPTSSWYALIQEALDNMDGEATAREMVEYFEKHHKSHPFTKKTHWKQTVYTYLSKYFEKKFVGGSRDTIYTYTRIVNDPNTNEGKTNAKKKKKSSSKGTESPASNAGPLDPSSASQFPKMHRRIQNQLNDSIMQPYMIARVPPIK